MQALGLHDQNDIIDWRVKGGLKLSRTRVTSTLWPLSVEVTGLWQVRASGCGCSAGLGKCWAGGPPWGRKTLPLLYVRPLCPPVKLSKRGTRWKPICASVSARTCPWGQQMQGQRAEPPSFSKVNKRELALLQQASWSSQPSVDFNADM